VFAHVVEELIQRLGKARSSGDQAAIRVDLMHRLVRVAAKAFDPRDEIAAFAHHFCVAILGNTPRPACPFALAHVSLLLCIVAITSNGMPRSLIASANSS
jgi:hypothetical protein